MPTISEFYGIQIRMFMNDHPPPHSHARYGEFEACFSIVDGAIIEGRCGPKRVGSFENGSNSMPKSWPQTGGLFRRESFRLK